ncbi:MAG: hypothetical protein C0599_11925 [Salinivirgaceae bacterium]|nr:MAG: hypothetical protein C0599_11925 [Salinivirgaceae bacterium]
MKINQREDVLYAVQVSGLSTGNHSFQFDIENKLLNKFENDEIKNIKVKADVELIKRPNITELEIRLTGLVGLVCDRCLGNFDYEISLDEQVIVKQASKNPDNEINIIIFEPETGEIVFDQYFYDMIMTSLPLQRAHENEEECDHDMIERLEVKDNSSEEDIDPRWNDLKNLI